MILGKAHTSGDPDLGSAGMRYGSFPTAKNSGKSHRSVSAVWNVIRNESLYRFFVLLYRCESFIEIRNIALIFHAHTPTRQTGSML